MSFFFLAFSDNASFISQYHLGPRYNVRVAEFSYDIPGELTINMGVTQSACSPVVHKVYGRFHNRKPLKWEKTLLILLFASLLNGNQLLKDKIFSLWNKLIPFPAGT